MQEKVTVPAAAVIVAAKVIVKTLVAKAAVLVKAEGAVNVQTGVAGQVKLVKVIAILPAAEI